MLAMAGNGNCIGVGNGIAWELHGCWLWQGMGTAWVLAIAANGNCMGVGNGIELSLIHI